jgi:hypothetical protein
MKHTHISHTHTHHTSHTHTHTYIHTHTHTHTQITHTHTHTYIHTHTHTHTHTSHTHTHTQAVLKRLSAEMERRAMMASDSTIISTGDKKADRKIAKKSKKNRLLAVSCTVLTELTVSVPPSLPFPPCPLFFTPSPLCFPSLLPSFLSHTQHNPLSQLQNHKPITLDTQHLTHNT